MKNIAYTACLMTMLFGLFSCGDSTKASEGEQAQAVEEEMSANQDNMLSQAQQDEGWKLLFDGKTTDGWHTFNQDHVSNRWTVSDGALTFNPDADGPAGDLVTDDEYENFHLKIDWNVSECGNSGIIFNIQEDGQEKTYHTGPEMQVLDNTCHPDAEFLTHRAGSLYDLIQALPETVKPAGEWNTAEIILDNGHLVFKLNGTQVVETQMFNDEWTEMLANSKFKQWPGFGTFKKGKIGLQDHGDVVQFKNIMIKAL